MKVIIYVEGISDKLAMEVLLKDLIYQKSLEGIEIGFLVAIFRGDGYVLDASIEETELAEHVIFEEVALVQACQGDDLQGIGPDGRVPVLGVEDLPVARGQLGHKRQDDVPD